MKQYDAYLFDMDGTVVQTLVPWMEIVQATLKKYGIAADKKTIIRKIFGNAQAGLLELGVPADDLPALLEAWKSAASDSMRHAEPYTDIVELLAALKQRSKKLALITATSRPVVEVILEARQLQNVFDEVVTGNEISAHKPDPEGILRTLDQLGIAKDQAVMLGDSEKDIRAANNAGIDSVLFYPPEHKDFHTLAELQADQPTYTIYSWQELLGQLQ